MLGKSRMRLGDSQGWQDRCHTLVQTSAQSQSTKVLGPALGSPLLSSRSVWGRAAEKDEPLTGVSVLSALG